MRLQHSGAEMGWEALGIQTEEVDTLKRILLYLFILAATLY